MFITCMLMDHPHVDYEISATMMAAIKCQDDRVGERGSRPEWAWETWQHDWVFRQDHEVWGMYVRLYLDSIFADQHH